MLVPADISSAAADWAVRIVCADRTEKSATAAAQTSMWEGLRTLTASLEPSFHLPTYTELLTALSHHTFFDYPRTVRFVVPTDVSKIRVAFTLRR
jgi:hypothetical protein